MAGNTGIMRCTIPQGRKDGKKVKGHAFDKIIGVGSRPGEEYAALNVLHQIERGKPLERLLAPEFRDVWLGLDKIYVEVQEEEVRRASNKEWRQQQAERRAKFEKSKESATINISAASRQMIEDALLEQSATSTKGSGSDRNRPPVTEKKPSDSKKLAVKNELVGMGFSVLDSKDASLRFSSVTDAIDYLCLNLDEAELPASLAPTSEVEIVQFYSGSGKQARGIIDSRSSTILTKVLCLSKQAAEKSLRLADGEMDRAMSLLYNTLTHNILSDQFFISSADGAAEEEKSIEGESTIAIYGEDASVGIGEFPAIENRWAAIVRKEDGLPQIGYNGSVSIAVVDVDGCYPFSAPIVVVFSTPGPASADKELLSTSRRRLLMRAAAAEVASLRESYRTGEDGCQDSLAAVPVIHAVLSFLSEATEEDLMSSSSRRGASTSQSLKATAAENKKKLGTGAGRNGTGLGPVARASTKLYKRRIERPLPVNQLRGSKQLSAMQSRRGMLPAHNSRSEILAKVRQNQVVVVSGATGSGKTTQVPQFLLEDAATCKEPISIVCTQPRRIAAMSVAERVAAERCEQIGGTVGYQVKLNAKRSRNTRLLFCTTGVLLRRLQGDSQLDSLTHILVDEVHERSVETDFLLLLLREIATIRPSLRIILMSATLDANKFSNYFASALEGGAKTSKVPVVSIPGRTFPVDDFYLEDAVRLSQYRLKAGSRYAKRVGKTAHKGKYGSEPAQDASIPAPENSATAAAGANFIALDDERFNQEVNAKRSLQNWDDEDFSDQIQTSSNPVRNEEDKKTIAAMDEAVVNPDLIEKLVRTIDVEGRRQQQDGAILIFLPGVAEISGVIRKLSTGPYSRNLWPLPLHSLLSPGDQSKVFSRPPNGKRKVICSTNIAETSITVEDVTVVIDTLRAKEMSYDALNRSSVLAECFISRAAAKQRAGRAGRVSKGTCYRLVRKHTFENRLAAQQTPEIKRVALEQLVLHMLSIIPEEQSNNDPHMFLGKAVDPPSHQSITTAITSLIDIGALKRVASQESSQVELTALGRHLTGLPVDARIGKLLIFGSLFGCVDAALTIAATISERSPFYAPFEKREEARAARAKFVWGKSDLLTFVKAFEAWRELRESRQGFAAENEFCSANFMSRKTLLSISDGRKQLADALADAGFGLPGAGKAERGWEKNEAVNQYKTNVRVVKAVVCAALYPNIARIDLPDSTFYEVAGGTIANEHEARKLKLRSKTGERLFLHPESVNFHEGNYGTRWLAYNAKVKTTKLYVRDSTMVSPYAILLFGGEIEVQHKKGQMSVDGWVIFKAPARVAVLARELRRQLDTLLMRKFEDADMDLNDEGRAINDAIIRLITLES